MTAEELLRQFVLPIVPICIQGTFSGEDPEYCEFSVSEQPLQYAGDQVFSVLYTVTINYYVDYGVSSAAKKRNLAAAIEAAGFDYPSIIDASDDYGQRYIFETSILGDQCGKVYC